MTTRKQAHDGSLRTKRVYEPPAPGDGYRILVDRLWPRGLAKEKACVDLWLKEIAPSDALRRRAHAQPEAWDEFVKAYAHGLAEGAGRSAATHLLERVAGEPVTLVYAAKDERRNNAVALRAWLEARLRRQR